MLEYVKCAKFPLVKAIKYLKQMAKKWQFPYVTGLSDTRKDPFKILIATILSARTKDEVTADATNRLLARANSSEEMLKLPPTKIAKIIYPVGFYNNKALTIYNLCRVLVDKYNGKVPSNFDELLKLPGVGRKTANLVIALGFNQPGICVDTHVHRISNRWGIVQTKTPTETEKELRQILPQRYWIEINSLMVAFGQNMCHPVSPFCSRCGLNKICPQIGVKKHR